MSWNVKDWWARTKEFKNDVFREMKNVSWPSREEVAGTTLVVIVATFIFGFFLYAADLVLFRLVEYVYQAFGI